MNHHVTTVHVISVYYIIMNRLISYDFQTRLSIMVRIICCHGSHYLLL